MTVENVPPNNIFNFDESNLSDDPCKKSAIFRRGVKYPEKILNHSKDSTTVMYADQLIELIASICNLQECTFLWHLAGMRPCCQKPCCSQGTLYNLTKSGWFDAPIFLNLFKNLSSHIDVDVISCVNNTTLTSLALFHIQHTCVSLWTLASWVPSKEPGDIFCWVEREKSSIFNCT